MEDRIVSVITRLVSGYDPKDNMYRVKSGRLEALICGGQALTDERDRLREALGEACRTTELAITSLSMTETDPVFTKALCKKVNDLRQLLTTTNSTGRLK